jgi:hypothetical protein
MVLVKRLNEIQRELNAPKNQRNTFGNYNYRSCEDILGALKPLLRDDLVVTISDDVVLIGDRFYVKAVAKITDGKDVIENTAFAREQFSKKGMDEAQVTGSASSYARKYALNGLLAIDDTKDADTQKPEDNDQRNADYQKQDAEKPWLNLDSNMEMYQWIEGQIVNGVDANTLIKQIRDQYKVSRATDQSIRSMYK